MQSNIRNIDLTKLSNKQRKEMNRQIKEAKEGKAQKPVQHIKPQEVVEIEPEYEAQNLGALQI